MSPIEQEAAHALLNACNAVLVAREKCDEAAYGSEIMSSIAQAWNSLSYALAVAEGRT
jgi:hypothetical protein